MLRKKRSQDLYRSIFSYLLVFLVPFLVVSFIWYQTSKESMEKQVELSNSNQLLQAKENFEKQLYQLDDFSHQLRYDPNLKSSVTSDPFYGTYTTQSLAKYRLDSSFVDEVYLYLKQDPNYLSSSSGRVSIENFLKTKKSLQLPEGFEKELLKGELGFLKLTNQGDEIDPFLAYIVPIFNDDGSIDGSLFYKLKNKDIEQLFSIALPFKEDNLFIFSKDGELLTVARKNITYNYVKKQLKNKSFHPKMTQSLKKVGFSVQIKENKSLGISYVSLNNPKPALKRIQKLQTNILWVFLIVLLSGLLAVYILGKRSYQPIAIFTNFISEQLPKDVSHGNKANVMDLEEAKKQLASFFSTNKVLQNEIKLQTPHAREQVLRKLMTGKLKAEEINPLLASVNVSLAYPRYFVMMIDGNLFEENDKLAVQELLLNNFSFVSGKKYQGYGIEITSSKSLALLISFDNTVSQNEVVQTIQGEIENVFGLQLQIGVGSSVDYLSRLNTSYIESLAALDSRFLNIGRAVIYYKDLHQLETTSGFNYPSDLQLKLIQSLTQGDREVAIETTNRLISFGKNNVYSQGTSKMYGFYLINTIIKAGLELVGDEVLIDTEKLIHFQNVEDLTLPLESLVEKICIKVDEKPQNQESQLKQDLFAYINERYASNQLSLENMAEDFQLSVSYLSRFIKKETGQTFSKYIQDLRMEKVKNDLIETDLPIKDIIHNAGYYDVSNYTRKFRKIVGVTPGQYRSLYKKEE